MQHCMVWSTRTHKLSMLEDTSDGSVYSQAEISSMMVTVLYTVSQCPYKHPYIHNICAVRSYDNRWILFSPLSAYPYSPSPSLSLSLLSPTLSQPTLTLPHPLSAYPHSPPPSLSLSLLYLALSQPTLAYPHSPPPSLSLPSLSPTLSLPSLSPALSQSTLTLPHSQPTLTLPSPLSAYPHSPPLSLSLPSLSPALSQPILTLPSPLSAYPTLSHSCLGPLALRITHLLTTVEYTPTCYCFGPPSHVCVLPIFGCKVYGAHRLIEPRISLCR